MQNIFLKRFFYACCMVLIASGSLRAQFEEGQSTSQTNVISCTQPFPSVHNKVFYTSLGESSKKIRNIVRFKINESALTGASGTPFLFFKSGFSATANLTVELWNFFPTGTQP